MQIYFLLLLKKYSIVKFQMSFLGTGFSLAELLKILYMLDASHY